MADINEGFLDCTKSDAQWTLDGLTRTHKQAFQGQY